MTLLGTLGSELLGAVRPCREERRISTQQAVSHIRSPEGSNWARRTPVSTTCNHSRIPWVSVDTASSFKDYEAASGPVSTHMRARSSLPLDTVMELLVTQHRMK